MKHAFLRAAATAAALLAAACAAPDAEELPALIPRPREVVWKSGRYCLPERVRIAYDTPALAPTAGYLAEALAPYASAAVAAPAMVAAEGDIALALDSASLAAEAYRLSVARAGIRITGGSPRGVVNGIATLRQLLPAGKVSRAAVPCTEIVDEPAFAWRGAMLDVSRHFFDKEEVLTLLDQMARLKLNKFHWHLTDDQGWRIEIRRYPDLARKGGWRRFNRHDTLCMGRARRELNDDFLLPAERLRIEGTDTLYGGFYTQQDIREVVAYATARGIDVIPEIDMPGHFLQAIELDPGLTCFAPQTWSGDRFSSPLCLGRDRVLAFCTEIWEEVFELFPYRYVHIGGDEVNTDNWNCCPLCQARMRAEGLADTRALQAWFTRRMQRFFADNGRRMIGWDEVTEGGVDSTATVMWWRPWEPHIVAEAAQRGCDVILCPQTWFYFSLEEDAGSLRRTCDYRIVPDSLAPDLRRHILGVQGNVWTEKVPSWSRVEYLFYPRLLIIAEKGWCAPERVSEGSLMPRLLRYCERLDAEGVNYRIPSLEHFHESCVFTDSIRTTVTCPLPSAILRYTLDGTLPVAASPRYVGPITFYDDAVLHVRAFHADGRTGDWVRIRYQKCGFTEPVAVKDTKPGLRAEWYFRRFANCDAVAGAVPDGNGTVEAVEFPEAAEGRRAVGIVFRGYIRVPEDRIYTFALASNDGSLLRIAGRIVVDNDGEHALIEKTGQAALAAGLHPLELRYFDYNGGRVALALLDEAGNRLPLDGSWLCHGGDEPGGRTKP